jgi:hypothetical protein
VVAFENSSGQSLEYTGNDPSVSAVLEYEDVAGATYRTLVTFDSGAMCTGQRSSTRTRRAKMCARLARTRPGAGDSTHVPMSLIWACVRGALTFRTWAIERE